MSDDSILARRTFLGAGVSAVAGAYHFAKASAPLKTLEFKLKETAGLRRFGYPVSTLLPTDVIATNFRLVRGGKTIPAQFREVADVEGKPIVALDFIASPGPLENESYAIEWGEGVEAGPEPAKGMTVVQEEGAFRVANGSSLSYSIPETLGDFLTSVRGSKREFLRNEPDEPVAPDPFDLSNTIGTKRNRSHGLFVAGADGAVGKAERWRGSIRRRGALAIGLRFQGSHAFDNGKGVGSVLDLTFPSSKSWVEATWIIDDPEGLVSRIGADIYLRVEGSPTLVDLGASNTVYGALKADELMTLEAGPVLDKAWLVRKGGPGKPGPGLFASATSKTAAPAEGWAHVMDKERCTAIAVDGFGSKTDDTIIVRGDGRTQFDRRFPGERLPRKAFRFRIHFVPTPVQVGAATSPQAMLAPLEVEWS